MKEVFDKVFLCVFIALFTIIVVVAVYQTWPKYLRSEGLLKEHARLERQIEAKDREIEEVRTKQRRFKEDRTFVEALARESHRVLPGELVFVFEDDEPLSVEVPAK